MDIRLVLVGITLAGLAWAGQDGHSETSKTQAPGAATPAPAFQIGGRNSTATIRALTRINGVSIGLLEERMRPGKIVGYGPLSDGSEFGRSGEGFLGADESLLRLLADDNDYVLGRLRLTHQQMAAPMIALLEAMDKEKTFGPVVLPYAGSRFRVTLNCTKGFQQSPFGDSGREVRGSCTITIENVATGKSLTTADMVPYLIHRYGFYEGKGTSYRLPPEQIVEVFDFLTR